MNPGFVIALGMGIVFLGLVCIVILCRIMNAVYDILDRMKQDGTGTAVKAQAEAPAAVSASAPAEIPNRQEFIAAVSAAIAEEAGEDLAAIRILSVRPL